MDTGVRRIVLLTLGWEDLPKSVSVEGASGQAAPVTGNGTSPVPVRAPD
jgi:hypothetical protein